MIRARLAAQRNEDRRTPIFISIVVHVVVIALIASITFTYPIASLFSSREANPAERIQYVRVRPAAQAVGNGSDTRTPPKKLMVKPAPA